MNEEDAKFLSTVEARLTALGEVGIEERWAFQNGKIIAISGHSEHPNCMYGTVAIVCDEDPDVGAFVANSLTDVSRLLRLVKEQDKRARHAEHERDLFNARIDELEAEVAKLKPDAEAWRKGHEVLREIRERVIPCGHKIEDLIGGEGSVTKCGACLSTKQKAKEVATTNKPKCADCRTNDAVAYVFHRRFDGELHPAKYCKSHMVQPKDESCTFQMSVVAYRTLDLQEALRLAWSGSTEKRFDPANPPDDL